ncbi:hypothetical protein U1Q18_044827 [Sarracenia purpurea var. burkii]
MRGFGSETAFRMERGKIITNPDMTTGSIYRFGCGKSRDILPSCPLSPDRVDRRAKYNIASCQVALSA